MKCSMEPVQFTREFRRPGGRLREAPVGKARVENGRDSPVAERNGGGGGGVKGTHAEALAAMRRCLDEGEQGHLGSGRITVTFLGGSGEAGNDAAAMAERERHAAEKRQTFDITPCAKRAKAEAKRVAAVGAAAAKLQAYLSTKSESDAIAVVCTAPRDNVAAGDKGIFVECGQYGGAVVRWNTGKKSGDTQWMYWHDIKLADAQTA